MATLTRKQPLTSTSPKIRQTYPRTAIWAAAVGLVASWLLAAFFYFIPVVGDVLTPILVIGGPLLAGVIWNRSLAEYRREHDLE
jgi:uncharacterized membrane protein YdcZ (DUF606 family)